MLTNIDPALKPTIPISSRNSANQIRDGNEQGGNQKFNKHQNLDAPTIRSVAQITNPAPTVLKKTGRRH
jgi:hypothetical protein